MDLKRKKFQGVLNILSFNRHFYVFGILVLIAILGLFLLMHWPAWLLWIVVAAFLYGLIMPLIVSAYVYDFSNYYSLAWLDEIGINKNAVRCIANINAGFDETSFILEQQFPNATIKVFDFYEPVRHTEPAIIRARKVSLVYPGTEQIQSSKISLPDDSADLVFLLSAVHEIRSKEEKILFFKECKRVCKSNGRVIIVEHLRDLPNFLAFTIGFTHFFSRKTWFNTLKQAGFHSLQERKFTPFMSVIQGKP